MPAHHDGERSSSATLASREGPRVAEGVAPAPRGSRRAWLVGLGATAGLAVAGLFVLRRASRFPPETTPEGVYFRVAGHVGEGDIASIFHYLEDAAQHAVHTVHGYRKGSLERVLATHPEAERARMERELGPDAKAPDALAVWLRLATERGFAARLRRDLSGIAKVERLGERATIETSRGTRYSFRRRHGGLWGLTLFTAELVAEAERAARDHDLVEQAARDYERAGK